MLKQIIGQTVTTMTPRWAVSLRKRFRLRKQAQMLRKRCNECGTLDGVVDEVVTCGWFPMDQKRTEILALLKLLTDMRPRYLCEIGTAGGGTLFLLCHVAAPDAKLLSIDIGYTPAQLSAYRFLARSGQRITRLKANSHAPETLKKTSGWLASHWFDFLFIDGDHSLSGVSADFNMYAPYVRPGGIVAFHDIVPDFRTRYGIATSSCVGQVPEFWTQVKGKYPNAFELVEDPSQDGYGIGLVKWDAQNEGAQV